MFQLFQDETEDPDASNDIVYDDASINQLLDRSQEGIEEKVKIFILLLFVIMFSSYKESKKGTYYSILKYFYSNWFCILVICFFFRFSRQAFTRYCFCFRNLGPTSTCLPSKWRRTPPRKSTHRKRKLRSWRRRLKTQIRHTGKSCSSTTTSNTRRTCPGTLNHRSTNLINR